MLGTLCGHQVCTNLRYGILYICLCFHDEIVSEVKFGLFESASQILTKDVSYNICLYLWEWLLCVTSHNIPVHFTCVTPHIFEVEFYVAAFCSVQKVNHLTYIIQYENVHFCNLFTWSI